MGLEQGHPAAITWQGTVPLWQWIGDGATTFSF
jgi:hypothetical protein